jgi:hypothetical protein
MMDYEYMNGDGGEGNLYIRIREVSAPQHHSAFSPFSPSSC